LSREEWDDLVDIITLIAVQTNDDMDVKVSAMGTLTQLVIKDPSTLKVLNPDRQFFNSLRISELLKSANDEHLAVI